DDATAVSLCAGVASASVAVLPDDAGLQLRVNLRDCRQPPSSQPREPSGSVETAVVELVNRTGGWAGNDSHFYFVHNPNGSARKDSEGADADSNRPPITFKQSVVFAVCGAIIAAFFLVAAVMRFRNRLKKKLHKRRQMEKELQSLRKKSIECRLSEAAAASRSRNSAVAEPPFFIVDFASLDNVQELDAMSNPSESGDLDRSSLTQSEEFAQGAAVAVTTAPAAAAASIAADSN
uniref:Cadherin domain-containing protein n=1 Tax=Macrostomum lignano TaxID=282301 RepID=A0A1I8GSD6_9PLAT